VTASWAKREKNDPFPYLVTALKASSRKLLFLETWQVATVVVVYLPYNNTTIILSMILYNKTKRETASTLANSSANLQHSREKSTTLPN